MLLDGEAFGQRFDTFERSAWRFEAQPTYAMPRESPDLNRWRAGQARPHAHNEAWHETVREIVTSGRSIGRVRVLRRPLTEYQRFQLDWVIPANTEAGEQVRVLDLTRLGLDLPSHDFWIFDDSVVVDLNFNPDGTLFNRDQRESPDLWQYREWRDTALAHSVSLSEWNART